MLILITVYYAKFMINKEQHVFSLKFGINSTCGWHKLNCTWLPFVQSFTCAINSKLHAVTYTYHT